MMQDTLSRLKSFFSHHVPELADRLAVFDEPPHLPDDARPEDADLRAGREEGYYWGCSAYGHW